MPRREVLGREMNTPDKIPHVDGRALVGNGVSAQRRQFPINGKKTRGKDIPQSQYEGNTQDRRPHVDHKGGGDGVSAQRIGKYEMPSMDQIPFMRAKDTGGQGVGAQRKVLGTGLAAPFPY